MGQDSSSTMKWYQGLTGYHWLVLVVAALGWTFDTMDQWLYVLARTPAIKELLGAGATPEMVAKYAANMNGVFIFGWATGGFVFGMIGDRLGRTTTMALTVLIYAVFTAASGLSTSWQMFAIFRFLTGLGIGGEFAAGAALIAEVFPDHARAAALGIMQACSAVGNVAAGVIGLIVASSGGIEATGEGISGWRILFFVGLAPALLVFVIRLFIKEPDKWHHAQAEAAKGGIQLGAITNLFTDPVLRRNTLVGVGLAAVGVIGFWGIGTFSPDLVRASISQSQMDPQKAASVGIIVQNSGAFFGILAWAWLAQRVGRKIAFGVTFGACFVIVPATFHIVLASGSYTAVLILFPIMGFFTTALFGGYAVYFPELFPTRLRATGTGFCYNVARYVAIGGPWLFGVLTARFDIAMAATLVSFVFLLGLFVVLPFARETKGQPLPE
ncbi:MAG: MFS transporter [Candidatus Hydrogenedentes bacterium]|nr:MFS transporter [Candidatus Hydrogenedentota bacterium]